MGPFLSSSVFLLLPLLCSERESRSSSRRSAIRFAERAEGSRGRNGSKAWRLVLVRQDEYRAWLDRLPQSLEGSATAEKLQAITELDLDELLAVDSPRGYGRD